MTGFFQTQDGCAIGYTLQAAHAANAPRLALIHSLALDRTIWDGVVRELDSEAHLLAYDCRGHGKSGRSGGPYSVEQFASDLAELLDHVQWPSAAVAGCSLGGCVAQAFGGLYPARAAALGLIDTTAWYGADAPRQWRERAAKAQAGGLGGMVDFQVSRWFSDRFRAERPDLAEAATRVFLATDREAYASTCILLGDADVRRFQAGMKMPVSVIVGEEDYATPVAMARQIHESVEGSTLTILPGARHLTPIEKPDRIAAELRSLLARMAAVA
ncbi:MAG TPA: alpha/beta fold hydrolase [Bryobacteraceae bacterium]|nr:alpha/beta fold hydrolase [Bryobacteraceae bacterium]HUO30122.1 alpha/beta fold hydrolase [Bryobacteraceae bacterium]